jgi:hypothetical protein
LLDEHLRRILSVSFVSAIIPVCDAAVPLIPDVGQPDTEIEVFAVNDGPTDTTAAIAHEWASNSARRVAGKGGASDDFGAAFLRGLDECRES